MNDPQKSPPTVAEGWQAPPDRTSVTDDARVETTKCAVFARQTLAFVRSFVRRRRARDDD